MATSAGSSAPEGVPASESGSDPLWPLVQAVRAGDDESAHKLLAETGPSMLRVIRKMISDPTEAEDLLQDAMMAFIKALPRFRHDAGTRHFACRVAVLTCMAHRRRQRSWFSRREPAMEVEALADAGPSPADSLLAKQRHAVVRTAMDRLPRAQAEVLIMHAVADMTLPEVAATLNIPLETARSRLRLALGRLRRTLVFSSTPIDEWVAGA